MLLKNELALYGCTMTPKEFLALLEEIHRVGAPHLNKEQLNQRPTLCLAFCTFVRSRTDCERLPEEMIMRRLRGIMKASRKAKPVPGPNGAETEPRRSPEGDGNATTPGGGPLATEAAGDTTQSE